MSIPSGQRGTPVVDIHTHMYPPTYIALLKTRNTLPMIRTFPSSPHPRLILLEAELPLLDRALASPYYDGPLPGRPLTDTFTSLPAKLAFMARHGITTSVISLANPWLDFLSPSEAAAIAAEINHAFDEMCASQVHGRLYFFAALPLTASPETIVKSVAKLATDYPHCRGVILGTAGLGAGLDEPAVLPVLDAVARAGLPVFLHPHYGLPNAAFGPRAEAGEYGHVLPLALGFPMETTIAVARMYLAGVFDEVPELRLLLAHSGGTLPFLAGRIESCVVHDDQLVRGGWVARRKRTVWDVLRSQVYLDAVIYSEVGLRSAIEASGGADRLLFGTDHPFFPPIGGDDRGEWESVTLNAEAVARVLGEGSDEMAMVMGGNAARVLRLYT